MWHVLGTLSKESYDRKYTDKEIIKRLYPYLLKGKKYLLISVATSVFYSIVSLFSPLLFARVFDEINEPSPDLAIAITYSILYASFLVFEWVLNYFAQVNKTKLQSLAMYNIRYDLFKQVNQHELTFFDRNKTGLIMSRVGNDAFQLGSVITTFVDLAQIILYTCIILGVMFWIQPLLSLSASTIFPILFLVIWLVRKGLRKYSVLQQRAEATINAAVEEYIRGIQITKSFGQKSAVLDHYQKLQKQKVKINTKRMFVFRAFPSVIDLFTAAVLFIFLIGGGTALLSSSLSAGTLYLFITYIRRLFAPLIQLGTFYATLQGGFASAERIFSLMDVPIQTSPGIIECPPLHGEIEFKNVTFIYSKAETPVLEHFDLKIPPGETLAIVGETGAGKTTIASLLARFYEYQQGNIYLDGTSLKDITPDSLRDQLGYVLQEPFLFSGTIAENLRLGSPNADEEQIVEAIKSVKADVFIKMYPAGIDQEVREYGRNLSQGQKQLISLARILLKDPRILILDEATASVDAYTEKMIQDALELVFKDRTTIVIAHRLSTILNADRIIVLEDGKIVEEGNHESLIRKNGVYRKLYEMYYAHQGAIEEIRLKEE